MRAHRAHIAVPFAFLAVLLTGSPGSVRAQDGAAVLRAWTTSQRAVMQNVETIEMNETSEMSVDGGFGRQVLRMDGSRAIGRGIQGPGRTIRRMELNGQPVAVERGERFRRQQRGMWRPEIGRIVEGIRLPVQELSRLRPAGEPVRDTVDGEVLVRLVLVPPVRTDARPDPIERVSAWFEPDSNRLRETLAVLQTPSGETVSIRTRYVRVQGLDLPERVLVEGSSRIQRRMRLFTTLYKLETHFSGHRIATN